MVRICALPSVDDAPTVTEDSVAYACQASTAMVCSVQVRSVCSFQVRIEIHMQVHDNSLNEGKIHQQCHALTCRSTVH